MSETASQPTPVSSAEAVPLRFVTAASLFDGHDASINIMRRLLQSLGAEVIHLGHNRAVAEVVEAAVQEDADGIAVSSYQGGHVEYFQYMVDMLSERGASHIQVFGGGGGVIIPEEIAELHDYGVARIYSPEDGQKLGLRGMIEDMLARATVARASNREAPGVGAPGSAVALARAITAIELGEELAADGVTSNVTPLHESPRAPVLGITGTGGAGKSSCVAALAGRTFDPDCASTVSGYHRCDAVTQL